MKSPLLHPDKDPRVNLCKENEENESLFKELRILKKM